VLALGRGVLPASLHIDAPSPHVEWASGQLALLRDAVPWPRREGRPRRAGGTSTDAIDEDQSGTRLPERRLYLFGCPRLFKAEHRYLVAHRLHCYWIIHSVDLPKVL
jgi:hypothetical protein